MDRGLIIGEIEMATGNHVRKGARALKVRRQAAYDRMQRRLPASKNHLDSLVKSDSSKSFIDSTRQKYERNVEESNALAAALHI